MEKNRESRHTVLVVSDVEKNKDFLRESLLEKYYNTMSAGNGQQALQLLKSEKIDLVLLHIQMPAADEIKLIEIIKSDPGLAGIPVVVSGKASAPEEAVEAERLALKLGAEDFVLQSGEPYILLKRIDNLLGRYTLLREAEKANAAKTAFLSRISHDMRTPLNGILGLTTLIKENTTDNEIKQDLDELELSGKYLLNLINDTLDVSRIESGRLELHPIVCEGRLLFHNAIALATTNAQQKKQKLIVQADDIPFTFLYVDAARMEQIAMNVIGNAIKFTPNGGVIKITMTNLFVEAGLITDKLVVEDTGVGISQEFIPHIFEAFSQEDAGRTGNSQGTGLGMAITKQLLNKMGGDISVESEVEKGSRFTMILKFVPATEEQIAEFQQIRSGADKAATLPGKRILLCEDHPLNAAIATRLLETKGMLVEHAQNGRRGVELFAQSDLNYYDAILMDIRMPVMNGIEAAKRIRSLPRRDAKGIPIIAMTANAFTEDIQMTRDAGMNAHISKPIETEKLYDTLASLLKIEKLK